MEMTADAWIAVYAAIVATGALALEIRRWFEAGPKIYLSAKPNMTLLDGLGKTTEGILVVNATNRGDAPTTITTLALLDYPSRWAKWRNKARASFIVPRPNPHGAGQVLPHVLSPGHQWVGIAQGDLGTTGDIESGTFWVAVYTTDRESAYMVRIPKRRDRKELVSAKSIE
jgi:hypothetical protein